MSRESLKEVYLNRRMAVLLGLGFSSGLPGAWSLFGTPLQSWLIDVGYNVKEVTFMSLITLPFAFNFCWAPLLDRFSPPVFGQMGHRRGWLLLIQIIIAAGIAILATIGPASADHSLLVFSIVGVCLAVAAATQDVLCDAYRTDVLPREELGAGAAVFVNGYRGAMLLCGGATLWLSAKLQDIGIAHAWHAVFLMLACLMGIGIVATVLAPIPVTNAIRPKSLTNAFVMPFIDFGARHGSHAILLIFFIVLFKLPDAAARTPTVPLLKDALTYSSEEIALYRETLGLLALVLGAFAGGAIIAKLGIIRSLWILGSLQLLTNLGFTLLAVSEHNVALMAAVVLTENFCGGMVTAGFIALLMSLCNKRYSATQYALFTSLNYFTGTIVGAFSGYVIDDLELGYPMWFALTAAIGLPAMVLLIWIREPQSSEASEQPPDPAG